MTANSEPGPGRVVQGTGSHPSQQGSVYSEPTAQESVVMLPELDALVP